MVLIENSNNRVNRIKNFARMQLIKSFSRAECILAAHKWLMYLLLTSSGSKIIEQPADLTTLTQRLVDRAIDFVSDSVMDGKPFFLYLPFHHVSPSSCNCYSMTRVLLPVPVIPHASPSS